MNKFGIGGIVADTEAIALHFDATDQIEIYSAIV